MKMMLIWLLMVIWLQISDAYLPGKYKNSPKIYYKLVVMQNEGSQQPSSNSFF